MTKFNCSNQISHLKYVAAQTFKRHKRRFTAGHSNLGSINLGRVSR